LSYLGIEKSILAKQWIGPSSEQERNQEKLFQETGLPLALCAVLSRLNIDTNSAAKYLEPTLRELMPEPSKLKDMTKAAERILHSAKTGEKVAIFADYDVDGGCSAALLIDWFRFFNIECTLYVPDRVKEGFGPNIKALQFLESTHSLIICVDCGTLSHQAIESLSTSDLIVLDHHLASEILPKCYAVVNPNRQDELGDLSHLCAAAVVFLCLVEMRRLLRLNAAESPDLLNMLDLVALATVADVAPLVGVNRAFVRQGLKILAGRKRIGLAALSDQVKIDQELSTYHLGFLLGPRINAGGRIGKPDLGAQLLIAQDLEAAKAMAERLDQLNFERRELENQIKEAALEQAINQKSFDSLAWAAGESWHPGVVGIVASRLKEATNLPSIVIGFDGLIGKGSGRSVSGVDLGFAIQKLVSEGLLLTGGGHKMAVGLSVARENLEKAMYRLNEIIKQQCAPIDSSPKVNIDTLLLPSAATLELVELLNSAGPYGPGAKAPTFVFANMQITYFKRIGNSHLRIKFGDNTGSLDAICFNAFDTEIGPTLENHNGRTLHLCGKLDINQWRGQRSVQLRLEDAQFAV
jgi:single-stranded-DNA-specific exonuclease